jgi:hypothetical protein
MQKPTPLELGDWVNLGDPVGRIGGTPKVPVHLHLTMGWSADAMLGIGTFDPIPYIEERLAAPKPKPEPKPERPAPAPKPAEGIAVTHSFATAV